MGFYEETRCRCGGIRAIIYIIGAIFTLLLGGILGSVFAAFITENLVIFAAIAAVVLLLLVIAFIIYYCRQERCDC